MPEFELNSEHFTFTFISSWQFWPACENVYTCFSAYIFLSETRFTLWTELNDPYPIFESITKSLNDIDWFFAGSNIDNIIYRLKIITLNG